MNDTAIALACESISKVLNRALEYDPQTPQKLSAVAGKSLLIESTAPRFTVSLLFTDSQLIIMPSDECSAPAMLSGTAPALIRLLLAGDIEAAEKCQVDVNDEDSLIPTLLTLSREIDIDWEALLAERTGDVAAHLVGETLRKAQQFQQDIASRSRNGWSTYKADSNADNNSDNNSDDPNSNSNSKPQSPLDVIGAQLKTLLP
ncbi:MAG: SCP2 domain-containing protein [Candidatus Reddybacter sp.]